MEDQAQPDPAKAGELAQKILNLLMSEDSETRHRALQAVLIFLGEAPLLDGKPARESKSPGDVPDAALELGEFFNRGEKLKPSDNAQLCAAYHYSLYGTAAFSLDDIRSIAADAGVVLPDRLDMTFNSAAHGGKKLFQAAGRGSLKPTAAAGGAFKERWAVKPGKRSKVS